MTANLFSERPRVRRNAPVLISIFLVLLALPACSLPPSRVKVPSVPGADIPLTQTGTASWYGPGFHGKATASGVIYNQNDFTAAHQTLPLGTKVMVTNLENGSAIEVTINDRGPFVKARIIDLSYAAGAALGMIGPGTIPVRIEVIDSPYPIRSIPASIHYTLQLGSFSQLDNAEQLRRRVAGVFSDVSIVAFSAKDTTYFRVRLGSYSDRHAAEAQARRVAHAGFSVMIVEK
jgi:rare lipoprotein A